MIRGDEKGFGKYILLGIIFALIFLTYSMLAPYFIVIISSFIFAYIAKPLFDIFTKKLNRGFSAALCMILVFAIFIVPIALITTQIALQAHESAINGDLNGMVDRIMTLPFLDKLNINTASFADKVISFVFVIVGGIASQLPSLLISLVLFLFCVFYILYDWDALVLNLKKFIPFRNKEKISNDVSHATHGIIYGHILVSFIDFTITAIVLYLIGIKFSLVIAFLVAMATFIPPVGTSLIFAPLVIYLAMTGDFTNFIYIIVLWFALGSLVDTYLSTKILAGRAKIHPVIMILGVLGGTSVFGIFGFIIGPLILVYTIKMIEGLLDQI